MTSLRDKFVSKFYNPDMGVNDLIGRYFENELKAISENLLKQNSINLIKSTFSLSNLIHFFINNYEVRKQLLKKSSEDFIFIEVNSADSILEHTVKKLGLNIMKYEDLSQYLTLSNQTLVLYSDNTDASFQKDLYAFKYFLGKRLLFIFVSENQNPSEDFSNVEIDSAALRNIVKNRILNLGVYIDSQEVLEKIDGQIYLIDEAIIKILSEKKVSEVALEKRDEIQKEKSDFQKLPIKVMPIQNVTEKNDLNLTPREKSIYDILIKDKFISRLDIAKIGWGEDAMNVKDDAIDQVISRLRKKFVLAGYDKGYIASKKGEGVILNS